MRRSKIKKSNKRFKIYLYKLDSLFEFIDSDYNPEEVEVENIPDELRKWRHMGVNMELSEYNKIKEEML